MTGRTWRARLLRGAGWLGLALAIATTGLAVDGWTAFGHRAVGERRARMQRSPQWKDGHFENPEPLANDLWGALVGALHASAFTSPAAPVATADLDPRQFETPPQSGLRATWLGHATMLVEIDGHRILTDPVWSERASPFEWIGPRRWYTPRIALADLPAIDAVIISHDHYDHLDYRTIAAMKDWNTTFVVPLGVGAHLAYWGVPETHVQELDWWGRTRVRDLEIVCTPARHASGRNAIFDKDATLWASYALLGTAHRAYFSGDTGLFPALRDIGARLGPFDLTMIETGQYHPSWPDWHLGPEQAVEAHEMLRGRVMLPMHWGLFTLAYHGWTEPAERALAAADRATATIVLPRPGQSIEPGAPPLRERWWPVVPWETAAQSPIHSTRMQ